MRVIVVHNPSAGAVELDRTGLLALLVRAGYRPHYHSTKTEGWKTALRQPAELIIAAGGDGTVAKVARELAGSDVPLAVLPLGTANNIAESLGMGSDPAATVASWATATAAPWDLARATGPWGSKSVVEAMGVGVLPTLILESARRVPKRTTSVADQMPRNIELLLEILFRSRPSELEVQLDGRDLSGAYFMLEAMNIRSIGPRLALATDADPGDGLLDIVMVRDSERELLAGFLRGRLNGANGPSGLPCLRGERLSIRGAAVPLHLDDRAWRRSAEHVEDASIMTVDVQVIPGAIRVLRQETPAPGER
jgi:diacylglycerol kinase family enzyme